VKEDELRKFFAARGMRLTEQRLALVRALASLARPASHGELAEYLASAGHGTTIYRNLLALADAGVLVRTQLGDGVWRYEMPKASPSGHGAHPHFVCVGCGDVSCLPESSVAIRGAVVANEIHEVQLRGRCAQCRT
jgi:Fur family ferric uptake transcriptional regulator